jgi:hypothetical protein
MKQQLLDSGIAPAARKSNSVPSNALIGSGLGLKIAASALLLASTVFAQEVSVLPITSWRVLIAAGAGMTGTFIFLNTVGLVLDRHKIIAILSGAFLAAMFGPVLANFLLFRFSWLSWTYYLDGASGALCGLVTTPALAVLRNPGPVLEWITDNIPLIHFFKKKKD